MIKYTFKMRYEAEDKSASSTTRKSLMTYDGVALATIVDTFVDFLIEDQYDINDINKALEDIANKRRNTNEI